VRASGSRPALAAEILDVEGAASANAYGRIHFLGAPLDPLTPEEALERVDDAIASRRVTLNASLNAAKLVRMQTDSELRESVERCDFVTADGVPVVWAARALGHHVPGRVNGTDLMELVFARAAESGYSVYLFGSEQGILSRACAEVKRRHPACGSQAPSTDSSRRLRSPLSSNASPRHAPTSSS
jgi:UDP-N-acetyl-D-mannosaminuronic acid transferase (WecB/TagA/CpsF family)